MLNKLRNLWQSLQETFWFLPAVMTCAAFALAFVTIRIDEGINYQESGGPDWVYTRGPEGARAILSTVAGSMITVAGVVFSVTVVALSLASSQFGPRLLRNFVRDRGNQIVLGTFVTTFVYCLLVLRTIRQMNGQEFVPHVSVTAAIMMALTSLGVLIYFIHHVSVQIQAPEIIANVGRELHQTIDRLFPEELGKDVPSNGGTLVEEDLPALRDARPVTARDEGYVLSVDNDRLMELAVEKDLLIRVIARPGSFVVKGSTLAEVAPGGRLDEEVQDQVEATFLLGGRRTPMQDAEYAVDQLVEVAVRALSPGINDPFTALACLDRLSAGLCHLAERKIPSPYRSDKEGALRVIARPASFPELAAAAFDQIRHYGSTSAPVLTRLLEAVALVLERASRVEDRVALLRHVLSTERAARELPDEEERQVIADRCRRVISREGDRRPTGAQEPLAEPVSQGEVR
jgi:uncharacterized membrane protein